MSWFARSIANTLNPNNEQQQNDINTESSSSISPRGVKDDLSELSETLTRQFWGVASFLAPPTSNQTDDVGISGIRTDLSEIGGKFKTGISKISKNINDLLQLAVEGMDDDEEEEDLKGVVGVNEEVVAFVKDLAMHPQTWIDFPFPEEEDEDGFDMTVSQQEHALAIEHLAPRLAALKMELCPGYMSESCFWMIYFVLLHPKLGKEDAAILSTPQIMDSRAMLVVQLQNESKENLDNDSGDVNIDTIDTSIAQHDESLLVPSGALSESGPQKIFAAEPISSTEATNYDTVKNPVDNTDIQMVEDSAISSAAAATNPEKHPISSNDIQMVDESMIEVEHANHNKDRSVYSGPFRSWESQDEDDADDWLKEETSEIGRASGTTVPIENDEDVSFSDFEEDDEDSPSNLKKDNYNSDKESREWVQL